MLEQRRVIAPAIVAACLLSASLLFPGSATILLTCGLGSIAVALMFAMKLMSRRIWRLENHVSSQLLENSCALASELHSMQVLLSRFPECSVPTTGWSIRFSNAHSILDLLDQHRPKTIVEFGSGFTTLLLSAWIREQGEGHLLSFDHDKAWAELTERFVLRAGLGEFVSLKTVDLVPCKKSDYGTSWYDIDPHTAELSGVDLVVVDGPPAGANSKAFSRGSALPRLHHMLSPSAVIVLDDAGRDGEKKILKDWLQHYREFTSWTTNGMIRLAVLERQSCSHSDSNRENNAAIASREFSAV